jgi:CubicO group peptidase (beta-lactamase class C family)
VIEPIRIDRILARGVLVLFSAVALSACTPQNAPVPNDTGVDAIMQAYAGDVPGASVLVVRDGKPLVRKAYGLANLEEKTAATPATNYRLASVTKQFTAASILLLAEDGRLSLDDHIRKWLPSLPESDEPVTIRHLLTHTGGLIDYEDIMPDAGNEDPVTDFSKQLRDIDVLHLLEKEQRVYFAAGTSYRYSNGGYSMLALIVERASGQSFQSFLHDRIFKPLRMDNTLAYVVEGPPVPDRAYGYTPVDGKWQRTDQSLTSAVLGDGGIYSSIDDLAKWDAALYDARLLSDASRKLAFTPWTKTDDASIDYGFGWRITGETLWHSGESIAFRNVIVRYPQRHLSVIILTNRNDPEPYKMALAIAAPFLEAK